MHYFEGFDAHEKYDAFYEQAIRVKNIMILFFAEQAQAFLNDYMRNVLKQPGAADWFRTWWTGDRGRYCLAVAKPDFPANLPDFFRKSSDFFANSQIRGECIFRPDTIPLQKVA